MQKIKRQQAARQTLVQDKPYELLVGYCSSMEVQLTKWLLIFWNLFMSSKALSNVTEPKSTNGFILKCNSSVLFQNSNESSYFYKKYFKVKHGLFFPMRICVSLINPSKLEIFWKYHPNKVMVLSILLKTQWVFCGVWGEGRKRTRKKKRPSWIKSFRDKTYEIGTVLLLLYFLRTVMPANPQNGTNTNTSHLPAVIKFL